MPWDEVEDTAQPAVEQPAQAEYVRPPVRSKSLPWGNILAGTAKDIVDPAQIADYTKQVGGSLLSGGLTLAGRASKGVIDFGKDVLKQKRNPVMDKLSDALITAGEYYAPKDRHIINEISSGIGAMAPVAAALTLVKGGTMLPLAMSNTLASYSTRRADAMKAGKDEATAIEEAKAFLPTDFALNLAGTKGLEMVLGKIPGAKKYLGQIITKGATGAALGEATGTAQATTDQAMKGQDITIGKNMLAAIPAAVSTAIVSAGHYGMTFKPLPDGKVVPVETDPATTNQHIQDLETSIKNAAQSGELEGVKSQQELVQNIQASTPKTIDILPDGKINMVDASPTPKFVPGQDFIPQKTAIPPETPQATKAAPGEVVPQKTVYQPELDTIPLKGALEDTKGPQAISEAIRLMGEEDAKIQLQKKFNVSSNPELDLKPVDENASWLKKAYDKIQRVVEPARRSLARGVLNSYNDVFRDVENIKDAPPEKIAAMKNMMEKVINRNSYESWYVDKAAQYIPKDTNSRDFLEAYAFFKRIATTSKLKDKNIRWDENDIIDQPGGVTKEHATAILDDMKNYLGEKRFANIERSFQNFSRLRRREYQALRPDLVDYYGKEKADLILKDENYTTNLTGLFVENSVLQNLPNMKSGALKERHGSKLMIAKPIAPTIRGDLDRMQAIKTNAMIRDLVKSVKYMDEVTGKDTFDEMLRLTGQPTGKGHISETDISPQQIKEGLENQRSLEKGLTKITYKEKGEEKYAYVPKYFAEAITKGNQAVISDIKGYLAAMNSATANLYVLANPAFAAAEVMRNPQGMFFHMPGAKWSDVGKWAKTFADVRRSQAQKINPEKTYSPDKQARIKEVDRLLEELHKQGAVTAYRDMVGASNEKNALKAMLVDRGIEAGTTKDNIIGAIEDNGIIKFWTKYSKDMARAGDLASKVTGLKHFKANEGLPIKQTLAGFDVSKVPLIRDLKHKGVKVFRDGKIYEPDEYWRIIRNEVGQPNTSVKGNWNEVTNGVFTFSNVFAQGLRGGISAAKARPYEVWSKYGSVLLASAIIRAGIKHLTKEDPDKLSKADKTNNYILMPIPGAGGFMAIPMYENMRMLNGVVSNMVESAMDKDPSKFFKSVKDMVPGVNPLLSFLGKDLPGMMSGQSPVDPRSGRPVIPESKWNSDDRLAEGLKYTHNQFLGGILGRFNTFDQPKADNITQKAGEIPIVGNVIKRFAKTSITGEADPLREAATKITRDLNTKKNDLNRAVSKFAKANPNPTDDQITAFREEQIAAGRINQDKTFRYVDRLIHRAKVRTGTDILESELLKQKSPEAKVAVILKHFSLKKNEEGFDAGEYHDRLNDYVDDQTITAKIRNEVLSKTGILPGLAPDDSEK